MIYFLCYEVFPWLLSDFKIVSKLRQINWTIIAIASLKQNENIEWTSFKAMCETSHFSKGSGFGTNQQQILEVVLAA